MKTKKLKIAFFGSSIVSAYWNGAATYYRGIVKAWARLGHEITFYEPDIYDRQKHRDIAPPDYCEVFVYKNDKKMLYTLLQNAQKEADIIIKASGVGAFDTFMEKEIPLLKTDDNAIIFWDVDAPATLSRMENDPTDAFIEQVKRYDCICTYGGGTPVVRAYQEFGARQCVPIYNALDRTTHFPVEPQENFKGFLSFLGNRLPDREERVEDFFIKPAQRFPDKRFLLGGSGWNPSDLPKNVLYLNHVYTKKHNAFNSSPLAVLNISRNSMASYGFSPATRVFEAAGAAACIITDYWEGIETFFEPGKEILVARNGEEVIEILQQLTPAKARAIGQAAYQKVLARHTYTQRVKHLDQVIHQVLQQSKSQIDSI